MGIEVQPEPVGLGFLIAAGQLPHDPRGLAVVHPRADVQRRVVVRHTQLGQFGGRLAFVGVALRERRGRGSPQPHLVVETAIDHDDGVRAHRLHDRHGRRMDGALPACRGGGNRGGEECSQNGAEHTRLDVEEAALLTSIRQHRGREDA